MKRFVNGVEVDLEPTGVTVDRLSDRVVVHAPDGTYSALVVKQGDATLISYRGGQYRVEKKSSRQRHHHHAGTGEMRAPMPGLIVDVRVEPGAQVTKGDVVLVLEAMKTQQPFHAPFDGTVAELGVKVGDQVADGQLLAMVEELE